TCGTCGSRWRGQASHVSSASLNRISHIKPRASSSGTRNGENQSLNSCATGGRGSPFMAGFLLSLALCAGLPPPPWDILQLSRRASKCATHHFGDARLGFLFVKLVRISHERFLGFDAHDRFAHRARTVRDVTNSSGYCQQSCQPNCLVKILLFG